MKELTSEAERLAQISWFLEKFVSDAQDAKVEIDNGAQSESNLLLFC